VLLLIKLVKISLSLELTQTFRVSRLKLAFPKFIRVTRSRKIIGEIPESRSLTSLMIHLIFTPRSATTCESATVPALISCSVCKKKVLFVSSLSVSLSFLPSGKHRQVNTNLMARRPERSFTTIYVIDRSEEIKVKINYTWNAVFLPTRKSVRSSVPSVFKVVPFPIVMRDERQEGWVARPAPHSGLYLVICSSSDAGGIGLKVQQQWYRIGRLSKPQPLHFHIKDT